MADKVKKERVFISLGLEFENVRTPRVSETVRSKETLTVLDCFLLFRIDIFVIFGLVTPIDFCHVSLLTEWVPFLFGGRKTVGLDLIWTVRLYIESRGAFGKRREFVGARSHWL